MRWDEQRVENEDEGRLFGLAEEAVPRTFDAPEAMGINFHEVRARSALNRVPGGRYGFSYTINPFRGCTHACIFCFARRTHTFLDLGAGRDFEREIVVKVNVPELLRAELAAELEARPRGAGDEHRSLPVGREPLPLHARDPRRPGEGRDAGLGADQVATAAA